MKSKLAAIAVAGIVAALLSPSSNPAGADPGRDKADGIRMQFRAGVQVVPKQAPGAKAAAPGANPHLSLLADPTTVDKSYWRQVGAARSAARAAARAKAAPSAAAAATPLLHDEAEPAGIFGSNDSTATAELVKGLGTGSRKNNRSRVLGTLSPEQVSITTLAPFAEDNGAIPLASDPGLTATRKGAKTSGSVGDGPHGSAGSGSGDFDFYRITATAGQQLVADADTPVGALDTVLTLYDSAGTILAVNDDFDGLDSLLRFKFTASGTYFLMMSGFGIGTIFPADPFDSGSGFGVGSEGPYDLTATVSFADLDFFAMDLAAGDTVGASVTGAGTRLAVYDPSGREVHGSDQDASFIYSATTPLPGGGNAVVDHVAARAGRYTIEVVGAAGNYDLTLELYRPGPEATYPGTVQTLFLDFDGARVNTGIFGGPGVRDLSPLAGFLGRWGLSAADEDAVIDATVASVRENMRADLLARGTNPRFGIRILNSRDHADPFGQPNVSRVVIGGTIAESGINTIGIAQSIDPGNFGKEETALLLLDVLSGPAGPGFSINTYLTPASNKIRFIGQVLGNITAHEAGHFSGNWHTDQFNATYNLMDQGGRAEALFGAGPDGIGGTADDVDVDYSEDTFVPNEGFTGTEDTLNTTAWAYPKGRRA